MMRIARAILALSLLGCDVSTDADGGATPEAGLDAGGPEAGTRVDPCAADTTDPASTIGCNGPPIGPSPPADGIDGACTPDGASPPGPGSCAASDGAIPSCDPLSGRCVYACAPSPRYVSTGGCPTGSRCFTVSATYGRCYRDCRSPSDCGPDEVCDRDGTCAPPPPTRADGGPAPDAG